MPTVSTDPLTALASGVPLLARRYARQLAALCLGLLLTAGLLQGLLSYRLALQHLAALQTVQAHAAATEIDGYLRQLQQALALVQQLPWGQTDFDTSNRRLELQRLLNLQPALVELEDFDAQGRPSLRVSRQQPDRVEADAPVRSASLSAGFAAPYFDAQGLPNVDLVLPLTTAGQPGWTRARINLRFLTDLGSGLRFAGEGSVYLIDGRGQLLAHPDPTLTLQQANASQLAVVTAARASASAQPVAAMSSLNLRGQRVISSAQALRSVPWLLVVEQAESVALAPVWTGLGHLALLLIMAAVFALGLSRLAARRMSAPIAELRRLSARLASGRLEARVPSSLGDELGLLADDFNSMAAQLQRSYAELEQRVDERTAELQLRRREAEQANAAKTRFLATASHDLRQPMHAIGLLLGALRAQLPSGQTQQLGARIHQAVQAMETMFGSLLNISRLDAGAVRAQTEAFALQTLLDRLEATLGPLALSKGLRWQVRGSPHWLNTDPVLLESVLANLCGNAIRYTEQGGVLLAARPWKGGLRLQVRDSGRGIAAADLARAFDEFVRLAPHESHAGLGLGLAIVRRSVELLGLELRVRSRPGCGSCFELLLPASLLVPARTSAGSTAVPESGLAGCFVLVVDDDEAGRMALAIMLQQWGCLVAQAGDANSALQELQRHLRPPDLVISDLQLGPSPDGLAALQAIRTQCGECLPALLLTAELQISSSLPERLLLLHKPAGPERLYLAMRQALQQAVQVQA